MEISTHIVPRPDGTRLRAFDTRGSGPAVVLANGLGGPVSAFDTHIRRLAPFHRVISWDYRGLYGSTLGHSGVDLSVQAHAKDIAAVLNALGVERAAFVGWSMGVQVGLELYKSKSSTISHLVLMNGTFGRPLRGVPLPFSELVLPHVVASAKAVHFLGPPLLGRVRRTKLGLTFLKRLGFIASSFDPDLFSQLLAEFETIDFQLYFSLLAQLTHHDAEELLPTVNVPTLVISGSRDRITPSFSARRIAHTIPHAELFVVQGATHYAAAEYPNEILDRVIPFLKRKPRRSLPHGIAPPLPSDRPLPG